MDSREKSLLPRHPPSVTRLSTETLPLNTHFAFAGAYSYYMNDECTSFSCIPVC